MIKRTALGCPKWIGLSVAFALLGASCGGGDGTSRHAIQVFAAASLTDAFADMAAAYEAAHPEVGIDVVFAASSTLREQIIEGAPADIYASADTSNMDLAAAAGEIAGEPRVFAGNVLQIAVSASNPLGVRAVDDLARADLLIGLCVPAAPCGAAAKEALARAGIAASVDTEEPDVRALLAKIEQGELDAGLVYRTDVISAGDRVQGISLPAEIHVESSYVIAVTARSDDPDAAAGFIRFVLSPPGRDILAGHGFTVP